MERDGLIQSWHDGLIQAGASWDEAIKTNLRSADIVICLLSRSFVASEYIYRKEMPPVFERVQQGTATIIPIVVRSINLGATDFGKYQCLPQDSFGRLKAINEWQPVDPAWAQIDAAIRAIVNSFGVEVNATTNPAAITVIPPSTTPSTTPTNLADFKVALNRLMAEDLKKAMDKLDKAISNDSDIFNSLIQLQARYNRNKKNTMHNLSTAQQTQNRRSSNYT